MCDSYTIIPWYHLITIFFDSRMLKHVLVQAIYIGVIGLVLTFLLLS